jgi:hypothetical protein
VRYTDFLRGVHALLQPPTYLEIGVRQGDSLALSRARTIAVDPAFEIRRELDCPLTLFRTTSDEYFAREDAGAPFGGTAAALSFIDGMHLFEFVLRDFVNVERHSAWWSVIVFDDVFPQTVEQAARDRQTRAWTGDVYKIVPVLERERGDLLCLKVDTQPTGLLLVLGADPASTVLAERMDALVREWGHPDPQPVPPEILERAGALPPEDVLTAPFWAVLREAREAGLGREEGLKRVRRSLEETFPALRRGWRRQASDLLRAAR